MTEEADFIAAAVSEFHDQGFVLLRSVVSTELIDKLRRLVERRFHEATQLCDDELDLVRDVSIMRMFEYDPAFREIMLIEPVYTIIERILGPDFHMISQNALRTPRGNGVVKWHIDDALFFPFLDQLPAPTTGSDPLPCFSLNMMLALSDIEEQRFGPTQIVAGSHRFGRVPEHSATLQQGFMATSILAAGGDIYIVNSQTWHRGAQNESDRIRYILTTAYGRRFISQRFYPFLNYCMPSDVIVGASDRLLRLLGLHEKGPYG